MLDMWQPEKNVRKWTETNLSTSRGVVVVAFLAFFCLCGEGLANLVDCERNEKIS